MCCLGASIKLGIDVIERRNSVWQEGVDLDKDNLFDAMETPRNNNNPAVDLDKDNHLSDAIETLGNNNDPAVDVATSMFGEPG